MAHIVAQVEPETLDQHTAQRERNLGSKHLSYLWPLEQRSEQVTVLNPIF